MTPYYEDDFATIYHGDALELAGDTSVFPLGHHADLLVLDLPYNVGKAYDGYSDDLPTEDYWAWVTDMLDSFGAVTLTWFPGANNIATALTTLEESIWKGSLRRLLAWHKKEYAGDVFHSGPAMCWEPIVWCGNYHNKVFGAWGRDLLVVNSTRVAPVPEAA